MRYPFIHININKYIHIHRDVHSIGQKVPRHRPFCFLYQKCPFSCQKVPFLLPEVPSLAQHMYIIFWELNFANEEISSKNINKLDFKINKFPYELLFITSLTHVYNLRQT